MDGYLGFTEDTTEWTGTDITFDITPKGGGTEVRFTHVGLVPAYECFDSCCAAWNFYVASSLPSLIIALASGSPSLPGHIVPGYSMATGLATIVNAHRILVIEAGRLGEEGSHASLMAANGLYARLARLQFKTGAAALTAAAEAAQ